MIDVVKYSGNKFLKRWIWSEKTLSIYLITYTFWIKIQLLEKYDKVWFWFEKIQKKIPWRVAMHKSIFLKNTSANRLRGMVNRFLLQNVGFFFEILTSDNRLLIPCNRLISLNFLQIWLMKIDWCSYAIDCLSYKLVFSF